MAPSRKQLKQKNEQLIKENKELRARLRIEENAFHIDKMTERKKLLNKRVTKWERIMRLHGLGIDPQDIIDWLIEQHQAPHPLYTSNDTMIMWLQAMDLGLSRHDLECYIKPVMQLWREQANPNQIYTKGQQDQHIAKFGANTRPVVLTITWQHFQQYLLAKEIERGDKEQEEDKEDMQSGAELEFSSILSVDTSPVDPVAVLPAFTLEFTLNIAPVRPEFRPRTPITDWPPLFRPYAASSSPSTLSLSPSIYKPMEIEDSPVRPAPEPHRYAAGPLPDLFPGYARLGNDNSPGTAQPRSQQQTQDDYAAWPRQEQEFVERLEPQRVPHVRVLPSRLPR